MLSARVDAYNQAAQSQARHYTDQDRNQIRAFCSKKYEDFARSAECYERALLHGLGVDVVSARNGFMMGAGMILVPLAGLATFLSGAARRIEKDLERGGPS